MSDREVAAPDDKMRAWMQSVDDELNQLRSRRLQGALAIESATIGKAAISATRTTPIKLRGSADWTQAVEYLGDGANRVRGVNGGDALVTRDERGIIQQIEPTQAAQMIGSGLFASVATGTVTPITGAVWGASFAGGSVSGPFPASAALDFTNGHLVIPVTGYYELYSTGLWQALADTSGRVVFIELSINGGVSWTSLFADGRANLGSGLGCNQTCIGYSQLTRGFRLRTSVLHSSASTPIAYTPGRMHAHLMRSEVT